MRDKDYWDSIFWHNLCSSKSPLKIKMLNDKLKVLNKNEVKLNMTNIEREEIFRALNKAVAAFENELKDWCCLPVIRFEARDVRVGDFSLGESIVIDQIKECIEDKKFKKEEDD